MRPDFIFGFSSSPVFGSEIGKVDLRLSWICNLGLSRICNDRGTLSLVKRGCARVLNDHFVLAYP